MRIRFFSILYLVLIAKISFAQSILDSCFTSVTPATNFISSTTLANTGMYEADNMSWNGISWVGSWPHAFLTIPPPNNRFGCRAIFLGSGTSWTGGGEGFGFKLSSPMVAGRTYSFTFTYVSHGVGSNGSFSPYIMTNSIPITSGAYNMGNLPAVGNSWTTNTYSFVATAAQAGHTWVILHTLLGSSGIVNSFCKTCNTNIPTCYVDIADDTTLCDGATLKLDATTSGATYLWQDNSSAPTYTVTQAGTYWVEINIGPCRNSDTVTVSYNQNPDIYLGTDTTICDQSSLTLFAGWNGATYLWQDNSTDPSFEVTQAGTYWVEVTSPPCTSYDTITVNIKNPVTALKMPNLFTPNNDGENDTYIPITLTDVSKAHISIFNIWGSKVYDSDDILKGWNGKYKGKDCSDGVYYWTVVYKGECSVEETQTGIVSVIR